MTISAIAVFLYLVALIWVVWRGRTLAHNSDMFNVFGRKADLLRATSGYLSLIGAGELITISQLGFDNGIGLLWFPGGIAAGFVLIGALGDQIRVKAKVIGANTFVGYVTKLYGQYTGLALFVVFLISLGALLTIQFLVGGQLLSSATGMPPQITSVILAFIIVGYLLVGGYVAVLSTDVLRLGFLAVVVAILAIAFLAKSSFLATVQNPQFVPLTFGDGFTLFILGFFGAVCAGDVWQTVFASSSRKVLANSMFLAACAFVGFGFLIGFLGMAARSQISVLPSDSSALAAATKFVIPQSLAPLSALMIVGSIMATADTEIWVLSTSFISLFKPASSGVEQEQEFQNKTQRMVRIAIPFVAAIALAFAYVGRDAEAIYEGLLILLTAIAPAAIAILFNVRRPTAVLFAVWAALLSFLALAVVFRLTIPSQLTFLPAGCSLIALIVGLVVDEIRDHEIDFLSQDPKNTDAS